MAKEKSLETLKVRVNKDGTLSKKSLEEIQGLDKPSVAEKIAGRITPHGMVESIGFGGLTAMWYIGHDPLSSFITELAQDLVETGEAMQELAQSILGGEFPLINQLFPDVAKELGIGMPKKVVEKTMERAKADEKAILTNKINGLDRRIQGIVGQIDLIRRGGVGLAMPVEDQFPRFEPALAEQTTAALEKEIVRLEEQKTKLKSDKRRTEEMLRRLILRLQAEKIAFAVGMAYITKKFLESYTFTQAVENIPLVQ